MAQALGTQTCRWRNRAVFLARKPRFMTRYRRDPRKFGRVAVRGSRSSGRGFCSAIGSAGNLIFTGGARITAANCALIFTGHGRLTDAR